MRGDAHTSWFNLFECELTIIGRASTHPRGHPRLKLSAPLTPSIDCAKNFSLSGGSLPPCGVCLLCGCTVGSFSINHFATPSPSLYMDKYGTHFLELSPGCNADALSPRSPDPPISSISLLLLLLHYYHTLLP